MSTPVHQTPVAMTYAEILANIRAAADALPEDARAGVALPEWRPLQPGEAIPAECCAWSLAYAHPDGYPRHSELVSVHGPRAQWGRIAVRYMIDGARGSYTVERSRDALLRLADKVRRLAPAFGAAPQRKPAGLRPRKVAASPITAAREFVAAGDVASAVHVLGDDVFIGHHTPGKCPRLYTSVQRHTLAGIDWIIGRSVNPGGTWSISHAGSAMGSAVGRPG